MSNIKLRTRLQGDKTLFRVMIEHPMETGRRKDETSGLTIPAHFITELDILHNERIVIRSKLSTAISRNPSFSFRLSGVSPGDRLAVEWRDNLGERASAGMTVDDAQTKSRD